LSTELNYAAIPMLESAKVYQQQKIGPDATHRNWNSYKDKVSLAEGIDEIEATHLLPDPQTNGGLLISVSADAVAAVMQVFESFGLSAYAKPIGKMVAAQEKIIQVI